VKFEGTPSDDLPGVLATGNTDAQVVIVSLSGRERNGRDAEYIAWHTLDHRPEQYRLDGIRNAFRLVSTPACRAARSASAGIYDEVDHVMTYQFAHPQALVPFYAMGLALAEGGRMTIRLPSISFLNGALAGKAAAARVVAGADVIPWRPCTGVYLVVEDGQLPAEPLTDLAGVAGVWWYNGSLAPDPFGDTRGKTITFYFLDDDPVTTAGPIGDRLRRRWNDGKTVGALAAPFFVTRSFEWNKYLP
jgi:hypothetical protein